MSSTSDQVAIHSATFAAMAGFLARAPTPKLVGALDLNMDSFCMPKTPMLENENETAPGSWERFERAVDAAVKSGPKHRSAKVVSVRVLKAPRPRLVVSESQTAIRLLSETTE